MWLVMGSATDGAGPSEAAESAFEMVALEAGASVDAKLAVGAPEGRLDGGDGDEQLLGDLAVAAALHGKRRDAALARGQCVAARDGVPARSGAGRAQLVRRARGEGERPAARRAVHRGEQRLACLAA